ncbi:MAG: rhodanese-related sulfurtransferase [Rubritalea sp.]|jgi:rhodanese-related sulfurtransferase
MMQDNPLEITCQQTKEQLDGEDPPILIDCREQNEYDFCRIEGAVLIPLSDFAGRADALFQQVEQNAIIYCHHGVRSLHAAQYLHQRGFSNILSMQGGIDVWSLKIDSEVARY